MQVATVSHQRGCRCSVDNESKSKKYKTILGDFYRNLSNLMGVNEMKILEFYYYKKIKSG